MNPKHPLTRWWVLLLIVLVGSAGVGLWLWQRPGDDAERARALRLARDGSFAEAEPLLEAVLTRRPEDVTVLEAVVLGKLQARRLPATIEPLLTRWCDLRPKDPQPYRLRFEVRQRMGLDDLALADGRHVLTLSPSDHKTRRSLAELLLLTGHLEEAERECRRCREAMPESRHRLDDLLARILHKQGRRDEAARLLDAMLRDAPWFVPALVLRGILHYEAGQFAEAVPLLRQALKLEPDYGQSARYHLSLALARLGQKDEAEGIAREMARIEAAERLASSARLQPDNLELQVRAGEALLELGRETEGRRFLQRVLARDPGNRAAARALASYPQREGR